MKNNSAKKRVRRNEEQLIADLHAKIAKLEEKKVKKALKADPALKLATKLVKALKKAETDFMKVGRQDLANSVKAAAISLNGNLSGR